MRSRGAGSKALQSRAPSGAEATTPSIGDRIVTIRALTSASTLVVVSIALSGPHPSAPIRTRPSATLPNRQVRVAPDGADADLLRCATLCHAEDFSQAPLDITLQRKRVRKGLRTIRLGGAHASGRRRRAVAGDLDPRAGSVHGAAHITLISSSRCRRGHFGGPHAATCPGLKRAEFRRWPKASVARI